MATVVMAIATLAFLAIVLAWAIVPDRDLSRGETEGSPETVPVFSREEQRELTA